MKLIFRALHPFIAYPIPMDDPGLDLWVILVLGVSVLVWNILFELRKKLLAQEFTGDEIHA